MTDQKEGRKTIRTLAAASFLNDMGSDMIYPIWPLFLKNVLHANMAVIGFIDGLGDAVVSLSQVFAGYWSDRLRKRKIFIWLGYLCGALSRVGYAVSTAWPHLVPFRVLDRAGKIRSAPRDAMVADLSDPAERGRNFGLLRTMDHMGALCGVLLCMGLIGYLGYRRLFLLAALPTLIGVGLLLFLIREAPPSVARAYQGITFSRWNRNFKIYLVSNALFSLGAFSYSFLLIFAEQSHIRPGLIPLMYLVFTAVAMVFSIPFGRLSDRIGRKPVIFISLVFWMAVCVSFIFSPGKWMVALTFILYGMHKGALEPVQRSFVSELAPRYLRASGLGAFQMVTGLCALPASFIAGLLWDRAGMTAPFVFSFFLTAASGVLLLFIREKKAAE
jgi:MFS family permease